ncbi:DUF3319 domain-containing protein [Photobacterium alginatilyticum]|nr:DUF3319 domain-containing protein [Photobacterium alginatilyticum]
MSIITGLVRIFGFAKKQESLEKSNSSQQQIVVKRMHYRGYLMESTEGGFDTWKARINSKVVIGEQAFIKESIDWWCDKKTVLLSDDYNYNTSTHKVEIYRGFKLINDTDKPNEWYMLHNGRLYKGTKKAIEFKIDIALDKSRKE